MHCRFVSCLSESKTETEQTERTSVRKKHTLKIAGSRDRFKVAARCCFFSTALSMALIFVSNWKFLCFMTIVRICLVTCVKKKETGSADQSKIWLDANLQTDKNSTVVSKKTAICNGRRFILQSLLSAPTQQNDNAAGCRQSNIIHDLGPRSLSSHDAEIGWN